MIYNWQMMNIASAYIVDANGQRWGKEDGSDKLESRFQQVDTETGICLRMPSHHNFLEIVQLPPPLQVNFDCDAKQSKLQHDYVKECNAFETTTMQNKTFRSFAPKVNV